MAEKNENQLTEIDKMETAIYNTINNLPTTLEANEKLCQGAIKLHQGSLLMGALALWNIGQNGLFLEAGFKSIGQYINERGEKLGFDAKSKSTAYEYIHMADNYKTHSSALYKAGFQESKDTSKLKFLHIAADNHGVAKAIKNLPKMSYREYVSFARNSDDGMRTVEEVEEEINELFDITTRGFVRDGKVIVSKKKVEDIIERGEIPTVIGVRDAVEARLVGKFLKRRREEEAG